MFFIDFFQMFNIIYAFVNLATTVFSAYRWTKLNFFKLKDNFFESFPFLSNHEVMMMVNINRRAEWW